MSSLTYKSLLLVMLLSAAVGLSGCFSKHTDDGTEAFREWAGSDPPAEIQIQHGRYWRSPHFTLEYTLYLEMTAPTAWTSQYLSDNGFAKPLVTPTTALPTDAPEWFKPTASMEHYTVPTTDCYVDTVSHKVFLFEEQL